MLQDTHLKQFSKRTPKNREVGKEVPDKCKQTKEVSVDT